MNNSLLNILCEAWGLPKNVRSLTLDVRCDSVPTVTVELLLKNNGALTEVLTKTFQLVERPNTTQP